MTDLLEVLQSTMGVFTIQMNLSNISEHSEAELGIWCPNNTVVGIYKTLQIRAFLMSHVQLETSTVL